MPLFQNGDSLPSVTTYSSSAFNGTIGQGDWSSIVSWNTASGERGYFNGWELNLQGLAFFSASGSIVSTNGGTTNKISGATLLLSGSNLLPQSNTTTNGAFSFASLTENSYVLNVSRLGYYDSSVFFRVTSSNVNLGNIILTPIQITSPQLTAAPTIGAAPLNRQLHAPDPTSNLTTLGTILSATWNFGDGVSQVFSNADIASISHIYTSAGVYTARLNIAGTGATLRSRPRSASPCWRPDRTRWVLPTATNFIWGGSFIGSLAAPLQNANVIELTGAISFIRNPSGTWRASTLTDLRSSVGRMCSNRTPRTLTLIRRKRLLTDTPPTVNGVPVVDK